MQQKAAFSLATRLLLVAGVSLLTACATPRQQASFDYTALRESRPASILVLPPLNNSPEVEASDSVYSSVTMPLAESGYYVFPVALVRESFRQNGLDHPADIHQVALDKLRDIFGADTALYMTVEQYGTQYRLIDSESRVSVTAKLVDLRNGQTLWSGGASASSAEGRNNSGGGLVGMLLTAVVSQIVESVGNRSHEVAAIANYRLLNAGRPNGLLYGPRAPRYGTDGK
jgi:hypothetical protein